MLSLVQWLTGSDVVTGSVIDREVIAINDGLDMIRFCYRSLLDTAEKEGGVS